VPPNGNEIAVPLAPIIAGLPLELRAKIASIPAPGLTINLPVETVLAQLAFGAVKISFGELRHLAVGIFVNTGGELDSKIVSLPLGDILAQLNPSLLSRRSAAKVEVAEDINGPFGSRTSSVFFTSQPMKSPPPAPAPAPAPADVATRMSAPVIPPATAPAITPSTPIAFRPPPGAGRFVTPTPLNGQSASTTPANGHHGTNGINGGNGLNGKNGANGHAGEKNGNGLHAPKPTIPLPVMPPTPPPAPKLSAAPAPVPTPAPAPVAPRPEPAQPTIYATISDLLENWPQELREEISRSGLGVMSVALPGNVVGPGLKRGRITMLWKELRMMAKPSSMPSPNDALELELPLKVITPLFFAALKNLPTARKVTTVSSEIPNLFFGFPQAAPTPPVPMSPPVPIVAPSLPAIAPAPVEKKSQESNSNFYVWGENGEAPKSEADYALPTVPNTDFTSRRAMPKDIVAKAIKLRGVAGVVVTLPDGLRVASEVPAEYNADTLAAFIPQMFERMNQSARELRMGSLNNVSFTVGNVPWRIIRVNAVYLAAFGRAGVSLPSAELTELAEELDRKKS
jgi:predicted regulator of Ras-like GTPase activity (Roadblock/LC7/MglB family)